MPNPTCGLQAGGLAFRGLRRIRWPILADEKISPEQVEIPRAVTGERRLELAGQLSWSARKLKLAGLPAQHPDWMEELLSAKVRRIFLHARS